LDAPAPAQEDAQHLDVGRAKVFFSDRSLESMKYIKFQDNMYCSLSFVHYVHSTACICKASFASIAQAYNTSIALTMSAADQPKLLDPTGRQVQKAWVWYRLLVARGHGGIRSHMYGTEK
jgi:hypothetical protein